MKTPTLLLLFTLIVPWTSSFGQNPGPALPVRAAYSGVPTPLPELPVFDLDFPGGTPAQLVAAIEKASGKPLNAIIPEEYAKTQIPGLKMRGVNVARLFEALQSSSYKTVAVVTGYNYSSSGERPNYTYQNQSYGFKTQGSAVEDSVWYFHVDAPMQNPGVLDPARKVCQFYQLGTYLDHDYKVEDITTAIETGWKMLGIKTPPTLNFHKETRLLIAVGDPEQLALIQSVLDHLQLPPPPPTATRSSRGLRGSSPAVPPGDASSGNTP